jgi:rhamnosyltransferase
MKLAATVILYNPLLEHINNIEELINRVDLLIIIDNSEIPNLEFINKLKGFSKVLLFSYPENIGISKALNKAASIAVKNNCLWMLTMDQDSRFSTANLQKLIEYIPVIDKDITVGMAGVDYIHEKSLMQPVSLKDVNILITSGSLLNLEIHKKLNGFDECLFIDEVDSEYCYRLRKNNFRVCIIEGIYLDHRLGNNITVKNWLLGSEVTRNIHVPVRMYYMVRNFLYVYFLYRKFFRKELNENAFVVINRIKNAFLYSSGERLKVLTYVIKGVRDYIAGRYGKVGS